MNTDDEKPRSIRFPQALWDAIDRDAKKSKRSAVKQMETVLSMYYGLEETEVDKERLSRIRENQNPKGILAAEITLDDKPKNKKKTG